MKKSFVKRLLHPLCLVGSIVAVVGMGASFVGLTSTLVDEAPHPYEGLLTFVLYPSITLFGLALILAGLLLELKRARNLERAHVDWRPWLDPSLKKHRFFIAGLVAFGCVFVTASLIGALRAYHYTESVEFCGTLCHTQMEPEYVAHQNSAHARVECVACHVGAGALGFIEAKVSGLQQLYESIVDSYPRPIRMPVKKMPVPEESCEKCHWRGRYWGQQLDSHFRFGYDLKNTRRLVRLVVDIGGGSSEYGERQGIHWHANPENQVWFRAADEQRQDIPWVKVRRADGTTIVYRRRDASGNLDDIDVDSLQEHRMTCAHCHNRSGHGFLTPDEAVDFALEGGDIERSLPFIKKVSVEALTRRYESDEQAMTGLRESVEGYYRDHFKGAVLNRREDLERSLATLEKIYRGNAFPAMNVDLYTYPDNASHRTFPGCFRCHGGDHVSDDGKVLVADCNVCHQVLTKSSDTGVISVAPATTTLFHPWKSDKHDEIDCWTCHKGKASPYTTCVNCHESTGGTHPMTFECSICHKPELDNVERTSCAACHPVGDSPLHKHPEHAECLDCHKPHGWTTRQPDSCAPCHERVDDAPVAQHYPGEDCSPCHKFGGVGSQMYGLPVGGSQ